MSGEAGMSGDGLSEEQLREAAAHGIRWSAIARPTVEVIQLGSIVILARLIVPAEFGRFAIALVVQEVAYAVGGAGLNAALVQRKALGREHQQTAMAMGLIVGLTLAVLTLVAASLIVVPIFGARTALFVRLLAPLGLLAALNTVPMSALQRRMAFRRVSEIEILNTVVRVVVCIGLALAGLGGEALVLGLIAGLVAGLIAACLSAPPPLPRLRRAAARELLDYAVPVTLASISSLGFSNVDYLIIGARLGPLQTGYYYRAYTLAVEYQRKIAIVMNQVGFPILARTGSKAEFGQLYRMMIRLLTVMLFPLLVLLVIAAPVIVPFLFGPHWAPVIAPVQILALGGASTIIFNAVETAFLATGRGSALFGFGTANFIVYGVSVWLVAPLGITAVAIDAAVVHTLFAIIAYSLMLRGSTERPIRRLWSDVAPAAVSCLGLVAVVLPVSLALSALRTPAFLWLTVLGIVAAPPYLLTLRTCFPAAWRAQCTALERILPSHRRLNGVKRRLEAAAAVH
jgi:PST family polysaccharide transporter